MSSTSHPLVSALAAALHAMDAVTTEIAEYRGLSDEEFREAARLSNLLLRAAQVHGVVIAGELAHRSRPELGSAGLARREGFRTPEEMMRVTSGSTAREAAAAVRVGRLVHESAEDSGVDSTTGEVLASERTWLAEVGRAVAAGAVSIDGAESIERGVGKPSVHVSEQTLTELVGQLCAEAEMLDADRLYRRARELRDELDDLGLAEREAERRAQRSLALYRQRDGMGRLVWMMDPETLASVAELFDRATSPRRGGPRFVSAESQEIAEQIEADPRTTAQLASDVFEHLLVAGADADSSRLLGTGAPVVRVLVTKRALGSRAGHARIEGQADPVSIETAERLACTGATAEVSIDGEGQPLNVGREQRLYNRTQRVALAVRDGGCRWIGCDRPPSWTEAHHVRFWARDGGKTDVADGILLCRHHHLLLHNNHWEIERAGGDYWLIPPPDVDPGQRRRPLPSKSSALRELMRERPAVRPVERASGAARRAGERVSGGARTWRPRGSMDQ
jgi:hypothetical protein